MVNDDTHVTIGYCVCICMIPVILTGYQVERCVTIGYALCIFMISAIPTGYWVERWPDMHRVQLAGIVTIGHPEEIFTMSVSDRKMCIYVLMWICPFVEHLKDRYMSLWTHLDIFT